MTHMASQSGGAVRAVSASSMLSQMAYDSANVSPDSAKWVPNVITGHRVYNFEVENTHTYIADGIRVHNQSVIDFVPAGSTVNWESLADTDPTIPGFDYVETEYRDANGNLAGTTVYKVEGAADGKNVGKVYTTMTDANGQLVQVQYMVDENQNRIGKPDIIPLTGAQLGEQIGASLTPFLTAAILDDDASVFENYATDTLMGTFLENVFENGGGYLHDQIVSNGAQNASMDAIAEHTWSDFGQELSQAASSNARGLLNKWIMAEIFGNTFNDDIEGKIGAAIVENGINYVTTATFHQIGSLFTDNATTLAQYGFEPAVLSDVFSLDLFGATAVRVVLNDTLPPAYTDHGQAGSAITSAAISFAMAGGPAGFVALVAGSVGWIVGNILDDWFPEYARYTLSYDESTGKFFADESNKKRDNGGDYGKAKALSNEYLDILNNQIEQFDSNINNYGQLSRHWVGYNNEKFYARKPDGKRDAKIGDFSDSIKSFFLTDMKRLNLVDGSELYQRAVDAVDIEARWTSAATRTELFNEVSSNLLIAAEYQRYLENQEAIDAMILSAPESNFAAGWAVTFMAAEELGLTKRVFRSFESQQDSRNFLTSGDDTVYASKGNDLIQAFSGDDLALGHQGQDTIFGGAGDDDLFGGSDADTLDGGTGNDEIYGGPGNDKITGGAGHDRLSGSFGADTFYFYGQPGHDEITDFSIAQKDVIYLRAEGLTENKTAYIYDDKNDVVIYIDENTTVRLWGVSTAQLDQFSLASNSVVTNTGNRVGWDLKFENPHTGSGQITQLWSDRPGSEGNDVITGTPDDNVIRARGGSDTIYAGLGNDFIDAGAGDDWNIFGDASSWGVYGKGGADTFFFARGNGVDQIWDFENGIDRIQLDAALRYDDVRINPMGNDTEIRFVSGALPGDRIVLKNVAHHDIGADDFVYGIAEEPNRDLQTPAPTHRGTESDNYITGSFGNDVIHGRGGNDQIYGSRGNDIIDAGPGDDWNVFGDATTWDQRGSGGADTYFFAAGNGVDQIQDFEDGVDKILLENGKGFDDVTIIQVGAITEIKFKNGSSSDRLLLNNTEAWKITAEDFGGGVPTTAPPPATSTGGKDLYGDVANDQLYGTDGNDRIYGRDGDDKIYAGLGNDFINAGAGDDWNVFGDARSWDDQQSGGADVFYFTDGNKVDQVQDFENGIDKIQLGNGRGYDDVHISSWSGITEIRFSGGSAEDRLLLVNVAASQINAEDFV